MDHLIWMFDNWTAYGKFQDTPNPEFAEYIAKFNNDPSATLVKMYTASNI